MNPIVDQKYIPLLQELIQNSCVNLGTRESGEEIRSVKTLKKFFAGYGLEGKEFCYLNHRPNLLLRIPGTDPTAPTMMFMGHIDVVPANPEGWTNPPFEAVIDQGRLWGRGSLDMLGQTAAMAVATAEIHASGQMLKGDLLFLAVSDEEAAGIYGAKWLTENHWDEVKADYVITELGGFYLDIPGPPRAAFTIGEKGVTQVKLKFKGQASHGSLPFGVKNANLKAAKIISTLTENPPSPVIDDFFTRILESLSLKGTLTGRLKDPETLNDALNSLALESPGTARLVHACSQMTASPNTISGGSKVNIIADEAVIELDIRTLPSQSPDGWQNYLKSIIDKADLAGEVEIEVMESFPSTASIIETPMMEACRETVKEISPEINLVPLLTSVATDGRFWRKKGSCVYGFYLFAEDATMAQVFSLIHGIDESVSLESLEKAYAFFRALPDKFYT